VSILGQKEVARRLGVKENTVNQWTVRAMMPPPDGFVSGNPAWHAETIDRWAWTTGRYPDLRIGVLAILNESPGGGGFATPLMHSLVERGVVGPDTSAAKVASVLTDLCEEGYVSIHLRHEWRITDEGRRYLADWDGPIEPTDLVRATTVEEIVRLFTQWELGASRSPNPRVAASAPLPPPTVGEARVLVRRLRQIRSAIASSETDWHGRPIGNRDHAAMGQLWEEWRDDKLGVLNGYRDVWRSPDPFYDGRREPGSGG
jgi:hypothetical protein